MAISREQLKKKLERAYPNMMLRDTEDFDGSEGGIWTSGEEAPEDRNGMPIFDYWAESESYEFGVINHFNNFGCFDIIPFFI